MFATQDILKARASGLIPVFVCSCSHFHVIPYCPVSCPLQVQTNSRCFERSTFAARREVAARKEVAAHERTKVNRGEEKKRKRRGSLREYKWKEEKR
jgi:hypothetical protein